MPLCAVSYGRGRQAAPSDPLLANNLENAKSRDILTAREACVACITCRATDSYAKSVRLEGGLAKTPLVMSWRGRRPATEQDKCSDNAVLSYTDGRQVVAAGERCVYKSLCQNPSVFLCPSAEQRKRIKHVNGSTYTIIVAKLLFVANCISLIFRGRVASPPTHPPGQPRSVEDLLRRRLASNCDHSYNAVKSNAITIKARNSVVTSSRESLVILGFLRPLPLEGLLSFSVACYTFERRPESATGFIP
ncbi:hypothetical protein ACJJTC_000020 [Scirpophaga incertulas]